jgi:hypothetical protein
MRSSEIVARTVYNARMKNALIACAVVLGWIAPAAAQDEAALREAFEGKRVTLRIDMPGTSDGVDVHPEAGRGMDSDRYRTELRRYGPAIHAGDTVTVTLVKVKKDLIEFQLGGGGFGTFGDDTSTTVYMPLEDKSERERTLERLVRDEDDRDRRRRLQRELDDLRSRRERANRRITIEKERLEEAKRARVAEQRLRGGSRFNVRYEDRVPAGIRPEDLVVALTQYVDFDRAQSTRETAPPAPQPPADINALRKGMSLAEAEREFGRAVRSSERREGGILVTTRTFDVGQQSITADFVEDVLVRYTVTSK